MEFNEIRISMYRRSQYSSWEDAAQAKAIRHLETVPSLSLTLDAILTMQQVADMLDYESDQADIWVKMKFDDRLVIECSLRDSFRHVNHLMELR